MINKMKEDLTNKEVEIKGLAEGMSFEIDTNDLWANIEPQLPPVDMALMKDSPKEINVHLIQGVDEPMPVGEPPMGPIGAAIANAVRRITAKRLVDLPLQL